jgi:hypothetical protein
MRAAGGGARPAAMLDAAAQGGGLAGTKANPSWGAHLGMRISPDRSTRCKELN